MAAVAGRYVSGYATPTSNNEEIIARHADGRRVHPAGRGRRRPRSPAHLRHVLGQDGRLRHMVDGMTRPDEDVKRLEEQSGGYGGPGVEAEESPEQRAADKASTKVTGQEEADCGADA